jgi:hypothetical protein
MGRWQYGDYACLFLFTCFEKNRLPWQQIGLKHGKYNNICVTIEGQISNNQILDSM